MERPRERKAIGDEAEREGGSGDDNTKRLREAEAAIDDNPTTPDASAEEDEQKLKKKIKVDVLWGSGYVWDKEDVEILKKQYKIHGCAVGTCPGNRQQNGIHGLPVQIQPEAVAYLLNRGVAEVGCNRDEGGVLEVGENFAASLKERRDKIHFPLVRDSPVISVEGQPGSELDVDPQKYSVYRHLLDKGYTITDGKKFGANFLVYDGSPQENHAFLTLKVNSLHEPIDPLKIIAAARVAHGARKHLVIASAQEENVHYLTFSPEGGFPKVSENENEEESE